jgi:hypothetical protein
MANRYWVGGSGTWNTSSTTNWSASSGGASGASVPTAADSVFFDSATTYTVTTTGALACLDFTVSAGTVTFTAGTTPTIAISGSLSIVAATVVGSASLPTTFNATTTGKTITTNGVNYNSTVTFNGVGGGWTLGSALTSNVFTLTAGTFDTSVSNYSLSTNFVITSGASTKVLNFNGSTVSISSNLNTAITTGLTFNAGTSQINLTANSASFEGGGLTFYNVAWTGAGAGTRLITGSNTFNTFSVSGTTPTMNITSGTTQTVSTFTVNGSAGNVKIIKSTTAGSRATLSKASGTVTSDYVSLQDSAATGGATWNATNATDAGNNTGWIINGVQSGATGNFFFVM